MLAGLCYDRISLFAIMETEIYTGTERLCYDRISLFAIIFRGHPIYAGRCVMTAFLCLL